MSISVLVLYHSEGGSVRNLARALARGVEHAGVQARLRSLGASLDEMDAPFQAEDLLEADALALGSPTRFGVLSTEVKRWLDGLSPDWFAGRLIGKPAAVFASTGSLHGGAEMTLLSMMVPLLHQGMLLVGLPYRESELMHANAGAAPYGALHMAGAGDNPNLSSSEQRLAFALGARLAHTTVALNRAKP